MKQVSSYKILWMVALVHAIYFALAYYLKGIYLIDSYGYLMQADNLTAHGSCYAEDWNAPVLIDYFSIRPPFYAFFINVIRVCTANIFVVLCIQNILSVFNYWIVYRFAVTHGCNEKTALKLLLVSLLFYPAQMIHANFVMTEILFQTMLLGVFLFLYQFMEQPSWKTSAQLAVLLSLCLSTKPVSLFLPIISVGIMVWAIYRTHANWKLLLPLIVVLVTFHVICLQNQHVTGYYHYSSIKSINQLKYNAKYTLVNARGEEYADSTITSIMQQANALNNYGKRLQFMDAQATQIIAAHPISFAQLYTKGIVSFFLDPGRFDVYHFFVIDETKTFGLMYEIQTKGIRALSEFLHNAPLFILLLLLLNFCWNLFVVCIFVYFLFSKTFAIELRVLLFLFVLYIAAATGPVGVSRYRVPVYPLLLIGVLFAGNQLFQPKNAEHA